MYRLERQKDADDASSRYVETCWTSSTGRVRTGAFLVFLIVIRESEMSSNNEKESMLVLELATSDVESAVDVVVHEREELELIDRRKRPIAMI
jgi:hypothetical protein